MTNYLSQCYWLHLYSIAVPFDKAFEVFIESEEPILESGNVIVVQWSPESVFSLLDVSTYTVDITLREFDVVTNTWSVVATLASEIPNNGLAILTMPPLLVVNNYNGSLVPVVIEVGLNSNSTLFNATNSISNVLSMLNQYGQKITRQSPMRMLKKLYEQSIQRLRCEAWASLQPINIGDELNNILPPCPCTEDRARSPNSGFIQESYLSLFKVFDSCGTETTDHAFIEYFHPGAASCFRQSVTNS